MAKKSRRAKKRAKQKRRRPAGGARQPRSAPSPTATQAAAKASKLAEEKAAALAEEYRYVYSDLQRIAVLAGGMLAVLILLSFVIR